MGGEGYGGGYRTRILLYEACHHKYELPVTATLSRVNEASHWNVLSKHSMNFVARFFRRKGMASVA